MKKIVLLVSTLFLSILNSCNNKSIRIIHTNNAPEPIGPYYQAVIYNDVIYCSGQIGLDPKSGILVGEDVSSQTRQALNNLKAVIEAGNSNMNRMLKSNIYLIDMNDFNTINDIYNTYFNDGHYPARAVVEVSSLPKNAKIEIEAMVAL